MRHLVPIVIVAAVLSAPTSAAAGPTCEDRAGEAVRCEDPRAMPLGWTAPLEVRLKREASGPRQPSALELGGVFGIIGLLLVVVGLMPDFEGWSGGGADCEGDEADGRDGRAR